MNHDDGQEFEIVAIPPKDIHATPIKWSKQQNTAMNMIFKWMRTTDRKQIFRLAGYAGTGKTTLAKEIAAFAMMEAGKYNVPHGGVLFAAYTGKAASVMRRKGCWNATTLHSLIYKADIDPNTGRCKGFLLNKNSPLSVCGILIIDEASMVNDEIAADILSFGCPVLVLYDRAQLEPVKGEGFFTREQPDYELTDIRRQAKDNPIIYLATRVREGYDIKPGTYGDTIVRPHGYHVTSEDYLNHDLLICGLNATRKTVNTKMRKINGKYEKSPIYPYKGDRLICLRNNADRTLFNGTLWTCTTPILAPVMQPVFKGSDFKRPGKELVLKFKVRSEDEYDEDGELLKYETQCSRHMFDLSLNPPPWKDIAGCDEFDFGYCISVHKAQGSQAASCFIFDESDVFRDQAIKHRYTAYTRASERMTVQL